VTHTGATTVVVVKVDVSVWVVLLTVIVVVVDDAVVGERVTGSMQSAARCDFKDESTTVAPGAWAMQVRLGRMYLSVMGYSGGRNVANRYAVQTVV
jgi:hypothetical protein